MVGNSVYIPAGVVHRFSNPGQQRARMMEIDTPGNFQAYFEELGQAFPVGQPIDQARMAQIQQQYDFIRPEVRSIGKSFQAVIAMLFLADIDNGWQLS
ncbi:hypothetical protein GO755_28005 [Spirosoma sp. HMF4905]|uniref:Cupin domain-containing protein n=1 Tax=Spirosoma arboris TaxID=2682092 RepID=A0A7K1SJI3_9BACT|nr:hypothetical protein [Spirosoma arboris]MVM33913.1 hypothetical protein [Spirosoma arboris]